MPRLAVSPAAASFGANDGPAGSVDVWLCDIHALSASVRTACEEVLSRDEVARAERFVVSGARDQFVVARALLRTRLSHYVAVAPDLWRFQANEHGKPSVLEPSEYRGMYFNVSHTDGLVACAVASHEQVGVDVEALDREMDFVSMARTICCRQEFDSLVDVPKAGLPARFFTYWTLKEAYIKARGAGMSIPLDSFRFDIDGPEPEIAFTSECPDSVGGWRFVSATLGVRHKFALAIRMPEDLAFSYSLEWVDPAP